MKIAIVYWSGSGNTEAMAEAMADGVKKTQAEAELFSVDNFSAAQMSGYDAFLFGCSAMGNEVLEEAEFEPFFEEAESKLAGIPVGLFGSYGWGDGEWMRNWVECCNAAGAKVFGEGVIINNAPDDEGLAECQSYAVGFIEANF